MVPKTKLAASIAIVVLAVGGCATGYQKASSFHPLGYTDEKVGEGIYRLTYKVNANTPSADASKYWHQRANELCGSGDYDHNEKLTMVNHRDYNPAIFSYQDHYFPFVEGTVTCKKH